MASSATHPAPPATAAVAAAAAASVSSSSSSATVAAPPAPAVPGILIGDRLYSEVSLTIDHSLIPEERLSPTPSMQDGLDLQCETDLRILGCELIQAAGILLRLPQVGAGPGAFPGRRGERREGGREGGRRHCGAAGRACEAAARGGAGGGGASWCLTQNGGGGWAR